MNLDILKEASVEHCENIYALSINYLHKNDNLLLETLVKELTLLEDDIMVCDNVEIFNGYKILLENLVNKIEGIINE